ncbi:2-hydroxy-3-keto-5-methylthiopentenyl-1-phosphat e phosphatase [Desulfonema ishimotonii]|uniref:2-hydroxy-3-keto-5-methylthiopentenyl-1-phosphat e phosphatase n=1 Tax=Desulfonema ishimotonii TaxID=45657 RepID=A0A401G0P2_9BACT|nr:HAD-IB family phosphatase [Desulfonema ishimotonii]GBC62781.1 2-hydroxy-3-keto-5-methylthiopentenyl-1-phosphat e phosphatase [Desulfonema ishimotonii]
MKRIVFCDFDRTITVRETFVDILRRFAGESYDKVAPSFRSGKVTLRQGVRMLVESIPSDRYPEMLAHIRRQDIRPGFPEFLDFLAERAVPFVVISGGLIGLVSARLESLSDRIHAIHAADVRDDGDYLQVESPFEGGTELVAKVDVMSRYVFDEAVAIGDGLTDRNIAMTASVVFARDGLQAWLRESGKAFFAWEDFFDIRERLARMWDLEKEAGSGNKL